MKCISVYSPFVNELGILTAISIQHNTTTFKSLDFWTFAIKTQHFGNWMFLSSGERREIPTLLGHLQRANLNH
jgi:hypothetical protein